MCLHFPVTSLILTKKQEQDGGTQKSFKDTALGIIQYSQYHKYVGLCSIENKIWIGMVYLDLGVG